MLKYAKILPVGLSFLDDETKVRKEGQYSRLETFLYFKKVCQHLIANPDPMIVPIHQFHDYGFKDGRYHYAYDMDRLGLLSRQEKRIIGDLSDEWKTWNYAPSESALESVRHGWQDYPELMHFLEEICQQKFYSDLHEENIMKDNDDNYRLIDIESINQHYFKRRKR